MELLEQRKVSDVDEAVQAEREKFQLEIEVMKYNQIILILYNIIFSLRG